MSDPKVLKKRGFLYYFYKRAPCAGYVTLNDPDMLYVFNDELSRLKKNLKLLLSIKRPILFHITIGAPMEKGEGYAKDLLFQWEQLIPYHLREFVENGGEVIHFIISPNNHFDILSWITPEFVSHTEDDYCWEFDESERKFTSKKYKYTVYIFHTMMPTDDPRNEVICNQLQESKIWSTSDKIRLKIYEQSHSDKLYIAKFYKTFANAINNINFHGGISSCFSFAVFLYTTDASSINHYAMFPELKQLYLNPINVLAEWTFIPSCYVVKQIINGKIYNISYLAPNINDSENTFYLSVIGDEDGKLILKNKSAFQYFYNEYSCSYKKSCKM